MSHPLAVFLLLAILGTVLLGIGSALDALAHPFSLLGTALA